MIEIGNTILETVSLIKPTTLLDVGCGCGHFTSKLAPYCGEIAATDVSQALIERCLREHPAPNISYRSHDARELPFPDRSFDAAIERAALHHISNWQQAVLEMVRVSSHYILIEEPIDDLRSEAKRRTCLAQDLMLELHRDAEYSHFKHLEPHEIEDCLRNMGLEIECRITKDDREVSFDEFFENYSAFAERTERPSYWMNRLDQFRKSLPEATFCEDDILFIVAEIC